MVHALLMIFLVIVYAIYIVLLKSKENETEVVLNVFFDSYH